MAVSLFVAALGDVSSLPFYNTTESIQSLFKSLGSGACNGTLELNPEFSGVDWEGEQILGALFTKASSPVSTKRKFLINFGTHAREYGLPDMALRLAHAICDGSNRSSTLLSHTDILIVPMLNVQGRERVESSLSTSSCGDLRKNGNLVDIDSNFDANWLFGNDNSASPDYRGVLAATEKETKLLVALQAAYDPHVFIDMRAGNNVALSYPFWNSFAEPDEFEALRRALDYVVARSDLCKGAVPQPGTNECPTVGAASKAMRPPFKQDGTALDWFYGAGVTFSFVFETFAGTYQADSVEMASAASAATALLAAGERGEGSGSSRRQQQQQAMLQRRQQEHSAQRGAEGGIAPMSVAADSSLLVTGTLASGALYDALYDCLRYYTPLTTVEYEAWVQRWLGAVFAAVEFFESSSGRAAAEALSKRDKVLSHGVNPLLAKENFRKMLNAQ